MVILPDLKDVSLDPGFLKPFEENEQGELVPDGFGSILDLPDEDFNPDLLVGSHALLYVQGEQIFNLFL